jgi:hypothetical protein
LLPLHSFLIFWQTFFPWLFLCLLQVFDRPFLAFWQSPIRACPKLIPLHARSKTVEPPFELAFSFALWLRVFFCCPSDYFASPLSLTFAIVFGPQTYPARHVQRRRQVQTEPALKHEAWR